MVTADGQKLCSRCQQLKLAREHFRPNKSKSDGYDTYCRECRRALEAEYRSRDPAAPIEDKRLKASRQARGACSLIGGMKRCNECGEWKPARENFYPIPSDKTDGYAPACIPCIAIRQRRWREANPEVMKERSKRRAAARPKDLHSARERERRAQNPEKERARSAAWREGNRDKLREGYRKTYQRIRSDPEALAKQRIRARIQQNNRQRALRAIPLTEERWLALLDEFGNACCYCDASGEMSIEHLTPVCRGGTNAPGNVAPACMTCNAHKHKKTAEEFAPDRAADIRRRAALVCAAPTMEAAE